MILDPSTIDRQFGGGIFIDLSYVKSSKFVHSARITDHAKLIEIHQRVLSQSRGNHDTHRLADCGATQCGGMSEGWGDFTALHMMLREGDDVDGAYAAAAYAAASFGDQFFGIRRVAYSVDQTKNALSFRHIADGEPLPTTAPMASTGGGNSEVHNVGEIWATMMWEAYVALVRPTTEAGATRTFDQARRAMSDYVVAGLEAIYP